MQNSIICGVDGSPESLQALRTAANLARRLDVGLIAAHVADPTGATIAYDGAGGVSGLGRAPVLLTDPEVEREAAARILARSVVDADPEIAAEQRVLSGNPAESLADLADEEAAMLIVVGSRGRGAFKAAFLGSVSNSLIGIARRPVLVVPPAAVEPAD